MAQTKRLKSHTSPTQLQPWHGAAHTADVSADALAGPPLDVLVVILNYNTADLLRACLDSVYA
ncbi:MAG: hypothetical protein ACRC1H_11000, partial [Caldilineaceae bacterium]